MKKTVKLLAIILCASVLFAALSACAASYKTESAASDMAYEEAVQFSSPAEAPMAEETIEEETAYVTTDSAAAQAETPTLEQDPAKKIIYRADLNIQTTEFDSAVSLLEQNVSELGGFVESSDVSGDVRYESDGSTRVRDRSAYYVVRVPSNRFETFLSRADGLGNVLSSSRTAENVTSRYTDFEARLSALYTQEERLLSMLQKAVDVENLIALEERLADVRYEIESIERNLRNLDMEISYSTVTVRLREVEIYTPTAPVTRTFGEKISSASRDGWKSFARGWQNFCIWLVRALPTLLMLAVIGTVGVLIILRVRKKKTASRVQPDAAKTE